MTTWPPGNAQFLGTLTVHGETRRVGGTVSVEPDGDGWQVQAQFELRISDFSIRKPRHLGIGVRDRVRVEVELRWRGRRRPVRKLVSVTGPSRRFDRAILGHGRGGRAAVVIRCASPSLVVSVVTASPTSSEQSRSLPAKGFFDLQVQFAERVRAISDVPLERALLEYTNLYVRFGLGREFDADHPTWRAYLAGLQDADDIRDWTYRFYLEEPEATTGPAVVATLGCFSYALSGADRIRLHFRNTDTDGGSPLDVTRIGRRRSDLAALFEHVKRTVTEDAQVVGMSWLYNLDAYRRLFPTAYVSSARELPGRFRSMSLWGQLLDRHGKLRETMAHSFVTALAQATSLARLQDCFPFPVLAVSASTQVFYEFYGI